MKGKRKEKVKEAHEEEREAGYRRWTREAGEVTWRKRKEKFKEEEREDVMHRY